MDRISTRIFRASSGGGSCILAPVPLVQHKVPNGISHTVLCEVLSGRPNGLLLSSGPNGESKEVLQLRVVPNLRLGAHQILPTISSSRTASKESFRRRSWPGQLDYHLKSSGVARATVRRSRQIMQLPCRLQLPYRCTVQVHPNAPTSHSSGSNQPAVRAPRLHDPSNVELFVLD